MTSLVAEVTDDKALPKQVRKQLQIDHAPHKSRAAALIKVADKICNLRDSKSSPPRHWTKERKFKYRQWVVEVVSMLPLKDHRICKLFRVVAGQLT